ncbi:MAG: TnpV protein [Acutalibacteraceae bacterium]
MDKYIYDKKNGLWYELQGDYYIPCLTLPAEKEKSIGIWGQRHMRCLKEHKKVTYTELLISGKLNNYLAEIDKQAQEMMIRLVTQISKREGVNEQLKAENPMLWVGKMNEIQARAREIVNMMIFDK